MGVTRYDYCCSNENKIRNDFVIKNKEFVNLQKIISIGLNPEMARKQSFVYRTKKTKTVKEKRNNGKISNSQLRKFIPILLFAGLLPIIFSFPMAFAVLPTITWDCNLPVCTHAYSDGAVGSIFPPTTTQFTVNDPDLAIDPALNTIKVLVNSTSFRAGITVTLTETNPTSGIFTVTNLIFTNETNNFGIPGTQTIGLNRPALAGTGKIISGPSGTNGIEVFSTTDSVNGIYMNLTETGSHTGIFTNNLKFTSGPSINGSSISVHPGDVVTIVDLGSPAPDVTNELVIPNPDPAFGALPAQFGDEVDAVYKGVKQQMFLTAGTAPGGGGGGLIRPSLVLDIIGAIGGSPYVVQPPSFGGSYYHFSDGLTFTQGNTKSTFDISHYNQDLQKQVMVSGEKVNMTFKTFESYNVEGVIHMGLYLIPRGQDMITPNSIASIEWDKGKPVVVKDPNNILYNATASSSADDTYQYTKFSFTPTKSYNKMSFLARAWNDHMYTTDVRVHDAIETPPPPKTLPSGVVKYDNFANLQEALYEDQFYKPEIMAHIHDVNSVFPDSGGNVYWLYDTNEHSVTLIISDTNDNELFGHKGLLQPYEVEKKRDYGFMNFTTVQLNRQNIDQIQKAMESEEEKAKATELEMKIIRISKW